MYTTITLYFIRYMIILNVHDVLADPTIASDVENNNRLSV